MSKIGEKPIEIPKEVTILIDKNNLKVKGPLGEMSYLLPECLEASLVNNQLIIKRQNDQKKTKSLHGLYRQLINNGVLGVVKMWEKRLKVVGTGYNVKLENGDLVFKVGYSHPVIFKKVPNVNFQVIGNNVVVVSSFDKQLVGEVAYQIKMIKKPDVYKGKGIQYEGEKLRIKPGKKAKAAGTA